MNPERWEQIGEVLESALALDATTRGQYLDKACAEDSELRREVESLLASHEEAGNRFLNVAAVDPGGKQASAERVAVRPGRRIGAYDILEEIGHGGMGEVFSAVRADGQYEKKVAIKLVRSGYDTKFILERFRNERQILASLDHPNIARLLDGGNTEDGIPYLVMELVEGVPVDGYCDAHKLTITQRLRLFREICGAVQYAHQRLVIHRDLKPSNILVTEKGTPKLLDFGIAKILDASGSTEATLLRPMTPEYASPEQIRGEPITTATDAYALGVVLYQLLTGRSPYRVDTRTSAKLAEAITHDEPERPSTSVQRTETVPHSGELRESTSETVSSTREASPLRLQRRLKGDLDNIVLKALRKEPERRYATVEQLAEDIRRHLEGLPVVARKDTLGYRTGKFVTRHKVGVAAAALVLLLLTGGMAAIVREAKIARAERARAEQHFNDVRRLANSFLFEFHDAIRNLPGSTPARELVVKRALEYLDRLAQESAGDRSLQRELADAYEKVGRVQGGDPGQPNLGDINGALSSFRKMLAVRQSLAEADPNNADDQVALARSYRAIADLQAVYVGDLKSGLENCSKAVAITESLYKSHPGNKKVVSELSADYEKLGDIQGGGNGSLANLADVQAGLANHLKSQALVRELSRQTPTDLKLQRSLAVSDYKLQNDLIQTGDRAEALLRVQEAVGVFERLAGQQNSALAQRDLAVAYFSLAQLSQLDGRSADAVQYFRKESQLLEPVVAADPKNIEYRLDLAGARASLGFNLSKTGHRKEGLALLLRGLADASDLYASSKSAQIQSTVALLQVELANTLELNGQLSESRKLYSHAEAICQSVASADPSDIQNRLTLSEIKNGMASAYGKQGDLEKARTEYQVALAITEPLAAKNSEALYSAFNSYAGLGDTSVALARKAGSSSQRTEDWRQARSWYQKSLDAARRIPNKSSVDPSGVGSPDPKVVAVHLAQCEQQLSAPQTSP